MNTLLKLKKINLKYQTGKDSISVLKNIDLNIKKKETVSVVGESGSGKTSLIMLIGGLEKPNSGHLLKFHWCCWEGCTNPLQWES